MKKIILILSLSVTLFSCRKEELTPTNNNNQTIVVPTSTITTTTTTVQSLMGQKWVITQYRVGTLGPILPLNDTLTFNTKTTYKYNSYSSTYSFYPTGSVYNLTMNYTPFGNLSGNMNDYNVISGIVMGNRFVDISMGSSSTTEYYLWMKKL
jgi:hypothetical protein